MDEALRDSIVAIARRCAEERGWTWQEPIEISPAAEAGQPVWDVRSNAASRGMNVRVVIRRSDLAVIHAGYLKR
jgi:hypothetical protein